MDTGSHLLLGVTLAGLAHVDPVIAAYPELAYAVMLGTVIGSHAPDFDTLTRVRGYHFYVRHHRGITHSIPALFLWPALLSSLIGWGFGGGGLWIFHVYLWTMAAVLFHVLLDLCNAYGVQCFRPFSRKWYHVDILPLFDPFIFAIHLIGAGLWLIGGMDSNRIFPWVYGITFGYILFRWVMHAAASGKVRNAFGRHDSCQLIPDMHWFKYQFVVETPEYFYTGKVRFGRVMLKDMYSKQREAGNPAVEASLKSDGVRAFLSFAQRIYVTCSEQQGGYVVQWRDVRFWYDHQLPFGVDVQLDRDFQVMKAQLGWRKKSWDPPYV
jgi:inner membrane protein